MITRKARLAIVAAIKYLPFRWAVAVRGKLFRPLMGAMGKDVKIKDNVQIDVPNRLFVGDRVGIGQGCFLSATGEIRIGCDVMIGHYTSILTESHNFDSTDLPMTGQGIRAQPIVIEDDVWIGAGARILPGVHIGRGCVIGANAVVTKDLSAFSIAGGVPARVIRSRQPEGGADNAASQ